MYTTNWMITKLEEKDHLMQEIRQSKTKYEITPVNALIEENQVIPGIKGISID